MEQLLSDKMALDDLIQILLTLVVIPDPLGIDHQYRSQFTSVQTAGLIDANSLHHFQYFDLGFQVGVQIYRPTTGAIPPGVVISSFVYTNKDVNFIKWFFW